MKNSVAGGPSGADWRKKLGRERFYRKGRSLTFASGWPNMSGVNVSGQQSGSAKSLMIFGYGKPGVRLGSRTQVKAESEPPVAFSRFADCLRQRIGRQ